MREDYPYDPNSQNTDPYRPDYLEYFKKYEQSNRTEGDSVSYPYQDEAAPNDYYRSENYYNEPTYDPSNYYNEPVEFYTNEEKQDYIDSYTQNYGNEELVDITSTQNVMPQESQGSGHIRRNMENSQYILYGQTAEDRISDTREMTSVSENFQNTAPIGGSEKETREAKRESKRKSRIKARRNKRLFRLVWLVLVVIAGVVIGQYLARGAGDVFAMDRQAEGTANITLESGASVEEVAQLLSKNSVIDSEEFFKLYCKLTNVESFNQGDFQIPTNMDYEAIINYLWSDTNRTDIVEIMFYEGMNVLEMAELLEEEKVCNAEAFLEALNSTDYDDYDLISMIPSGKKKYYKLEGYLFPDTYQFYQNSDPEEVISKMVYNTQSKILTDEIQERAEELDLTMDELVIFASLVQAEASDNDDMYNVSSVIHNRLEYGSEYDIYTLGLEATMYYPYHNKAGLPADMKDYTSSYSTYENGGLPDGAICNPGMNAFKAVLYPNDTDYLYFLHGPDGQSYYAVTQEEHDQNYIDAGLEQLYTE